MPILGNALKGGHDTSILFWENTLLKWLYHPTLSIISKEKINEKRGQVLQKGICSLESDLSKSECKSKMPARGCVLFFMKWPVFVFG
jgi:hypothetical protein